MIGKVQMQVQYPFHRVPNNIPRFPSREFEKRITGMSGTSTSTKRATQAIGANIAEQVLVLDFGSQTAQLIARRVRENNVFCQLVRHDLPASRIRQIAPKGLILSGGPASVYGKGSPQPDPEIFNLGIPILGICYGMQQ